MLNNRNRNYRQRNNAKEDGYAILILLCLPFVCLCCALDACGCFDDDDSESESSDGGVVRNNINKVEDTGVNDDAITREPHWSTGIRELYQHNHQPPKNNIPKVNDTAISHWADWQFFKCKILSFNTNTMSYKVKWNDGDTTKIIQKYDLVALNKIPEPSDIGIGSKVLFEQGQYHIGKKKQVSAGYRFHLGIVESVRKDEYGKIAFSGRHLRGTEDGKWCSYPGYNLYFKDYGVMRLRTLPNSEQIFKEFSAVRTPVLTSRSQDMSNRSMVPSAPPASDMYDVPRSQNRNKEIPLAGSSNDAFDVVAPPSYGEAMNH